MGSRLAAWLHRSPPLLVGWYQFSSHTCRCFVPFNDFPTFLPGIHTMIYPFAAMHRLMFCCALDMLHATRKAFEQGWAATNIIT